MRRLYCSLQGAVQVHECPYNKKKTDSNANRKCLSAHQKATQVLSIF
jgi:hypothetical protein